MIRLQVAIFLHLKADGPQLILARRKLRLETTKREQRKEQRSCGDNNRGDRHKIGPGEMPLAPDVLPSQSTRRQMHSPSRVGDIPTSPLGQSRRWLIRCTFLSQAHVLDTRPKLPHLGSQSRISLDLGLDLLEFIRRKGAEKIAEQMFA
jgi:hypothetical protein